MNFAIVKSGVVTTIIVATTAQDVTWVPCDGLPAFIGGAYDGTFHPPAQPALPVVVPTTKMTKLAFKKRFPSAKWKAARGAATAGSDLYDFFEDWDASTYIDVSRQVQTIDPVNSLTNGAVPVEYRLTASEVSLILTNPILDFEQYQP